MNAAGTPKSESVGPPAVQHKHEHQAHTAHFYHDEAFLLDSLSQQVGEALGFGGTAIVIATRSHRDDLERRLKERGLDIIGAGQQERYVALDAAETLAKFMLDGRPDEARFREVVGEAVRRAALATGSERPRVVVFGEMVTLLWQEGKSQGAIQLEHLWNDFIERHSFTVHCAYPMSAFLGQEDSKLFRVICEQHSCVLSAAGQGQPFNEIDYQRNIALLEQKTQALETEKALRESEQRFRLLVESVQDYAIFMLDCEGRVNSWSSGAQRIKGYNAAEIIGRHFSCLYSDEDIRSGKPQKELDIAAEQGYFEDEGWRLRKDGSRFWANVVITALRDGNGSLCGFSKVTRDITERMRAVEILKESNESLKEEVHERLEAEQKLQESETSLRMLSRSLFRIQDEERKHIGQELHDSVGQCLAALKMELDSLHSDADLQGKGARQQIEGSIRLAEQCIKEVRTMSYLLYPPLLEEMGLKMAIPWHLDGFAKRSGIRTEFSIPDDFGRLPRDLELILFRILQESLTNVHRHSGSPTALVRLFMENDVAIMEVYDSGKGVPTTVLGDVLTAGVGLRGMNERARQVGGKLEIFSAEKGTIVRASIPCAKAPSEGSIH